MKTFSMIAIVSVATAGVALADDPKAAKAPAAGAPAAKAPAAGAPAAKAAMPEMPKPPAEIADMAKMAGGTWRCKGDGFEPDGSKSPVTMTNKTKLSPDKWWVVENLEVKGKMTFKMDAFTTFDAASKKWRKVGIDSMGSYMVGTSDGLKDGKVTFNLDGVGPMGAYQFRDHGDLTDAKAPKFWGEMSMDKGKTWMKAYEVVCKK